MSGDNQKIEMEDQNKKSLPLIQDITGLAGVCFDVWRDQNNHDDLDINQMIILLDAIGIKKNEYELNYWIDKWKQEAKLDMTSERINRDNFIRIVTNFKEKHSYIEEKFLAEAFSRMDEKNKGVLYFQDLKKFCQGAIKDIKDEEIWEMIDVAWEEDAPEIGREQHLAETRDNRYMTYESFFKLYHLG